MRHNLNIFSGCKMCCKGELGHDNHAVNNTKLLTFTAICVYYPHYESGMKHLYDLSVIPIHRRLSLALEFVPTYIPNSDVFIMSNDSL